MRTRFLVALLSSAMLASSAYAATFFTDSGAFSASTTGLTSSNFTGIASPGSFTTQSSFTVSGVTFDSPGADFVIDGAYFNGIYYGGAPYFSSQGNAATAISFAGTTAFGMFYGSYANVGTPISFTLSDGSLFNTSLPGTQGTAAFFGFTSAAPITGITVNNQSGGSFVFDVVSFQVGEAVSTAVPEPESWAMMIMGFGLAGAAMRRRRAAIA